MVFDGCINSMVRTVLPSRKSKPPYIRAIPTTPIVVGGVSSNLRAIETGDILGKTLTGIGTSAQAHGDTGAHWPVKRHHDADEAVPNRRVLAPHRVRDVDVVRVGNAKRGANTAERIRDGNVGASYPPVGGKGHLRIASTVVQSSDRKAGDLGIRSLVQPGSCFQ